ncbi:NAD(P)/FAD-dependent oxidoreductase [Paenibacillus nanensis]|nr:FAD-binding oxidoreductase [Paenibacillus nanensis]
MEKDVSASSVKSVIVIGAGILGASTAYQLAKMGAKVLIIDRQDQGQATDAAAGIICPWLSQRRNKAWYRLAKAGASFYPGLIEELTKEGETETGYAKVGALSIHEDMAKIAKLEERAQQRKPDAPEIGEITRLDPQETIARFPLLADGHHSVHISGAARVDGRALRDALVRSAQRHGAAFIRGDAEIRYESHRVIGAAAGGEFFKADAVIVCAGAWARQLLQPLGIAFKVGYQKAQIMHVQAADQYETGSWPVVMPPSDQYLLAFEDWRIVIGATHEDDIDGYDTRITAGGMQEILNKGMMAAPGLKNASFREVRVGFRPHTPGYLPVIGQFPGWEGLYSANGLGASGLTTGPFIGCQLAKLALGMEPDFDLNDYDIRNAIEGEEAGLKTD